MQPLVIGIAVYKIIIACINVVYSVFDEVGEGGAQLCQVFGALAVGGTIEHRAFSHLPGGVGGGILVGIDIARVGAYLVIVVVPHVLHAVNKSLELVGRAGGLARGIHLELAYVERNARNVGSGKGALCRLVLVGSALNHETQVLERLGHGYLGRLVRLPYDNLVGGKVAVLGCEFGNERPLVLVGVRRACGHRRVVRCINDHVVGVVVVRGVVVALVLEAERADRRTEGNLYVVVARVGIHAVIKPG